MLPILILLILSVTWAERVFVVERERSAISVVEEGKVVGRLENVGDMAHGVIKFRDGKGYILGRDGTLTLFDPEDSRVLAQKKVAESSVGFTFCGEWIAVANYQPGSLSLVSRDLTSVREFSFGSRVVGVKAKGPLLVFSLMDRNEVVVFNCVKLKEVARVRSGGSLPFDALLRGDSYLVAFFERGGLGLLNLKDLSFRSVRAGTPEGIPLKVPHLGLWGIKGTKAFIPAVGENRLYLYSFREERILGWVDLPGYPVFAVLSPDRSQVVVNYSGEAEDYLSLIDTDTLRVIKTKRAGKRITHLRFSKNGERLYVSSFYENELKALRLPDLQVLWRVKVPTPSGIFLNGE